MQSGGEASHAPRTRTAVLAVAVILGVVVGFGAGWFLRPPPSTAALEEALNGAELTPERRAALDEAYPDQPYIGGQATPEHVWRILPNGDLEAIHFNKPTLAEATRIWYVVVGIHVMDACNKPADEGFTHFHKKSSPNWDAGHGGTSDPVVEGYWLKHVAVSEFDMPWGHVMPGADYNFMKTPIQGCPPP
jgi:hypothetical protein